MPSSFADVNHLLRRAGFGGSTTEIAALTALEWPDVVEAVLDVGSSRPLSENLPDINSGRRNWDNYVDMVQYWAERSRTSSCPIQEKMVLFWHGHLCTSGDKVHDSPMLFAQNQLLRTHGLGSFEDLVQAISVQPAMLLYLDNAENRAGSPNENFARELMELFTLGVGNYTEDDVQASARAWTGHGVNKDTGQYIFRPEEHDFGNKTFMGITQDWDGPLIIQHLLRGPTKIVAARFIVRELWEFFAYSNPADSIVHSIADEFAASDLNLTSALREIFLHPAFRSTECLNGLVRGPIDFLVSLMRQVGVDSSVTNPQWSVAPMGQRLFYPPTVEGWKQNEAWISGSNVWGKNACVSAVRWHLYKHTEYLDMPDASPADLTTAALELFGIFNASTQTRENLQAFCRSEPNSWARRAGMLQLTPLTPEFQMA